MENRCYLQLSGWYDIIERGTEGTIPLNEDSIKTAPKVNITTSHSSKWEVKSARPFSEEEIAAVKSAKVVPSEYGNSVCFTMVTGLMKYITLDRESSLTPGEEVDLTKAKLVTLGKHGEDDILRVSI